VKDRKEQLKKKQEELRMVEKDITVLSMLINGTLPDDMKQSGKNQYFSIEFC